ncbi:hypothetical protein KEM56_003658, partial [Ascosphaera pollenicola]
VVYLEVSLVGSFMKFGGATLLKVPLPLPGVATKVEHWQRRPLGSLEAPILREEEDGKDGEFELIFS